MEKPSRRFSSQPSVYSIARHSSVEPYIWYSILLSTGSLISGLAGANLNPRPLPSKAQNRRNRHARECTGPATSVILPSRTGNHLKPGCLAWPVGARHSDAGRVVSQFEKLRPRLVEPGPRIGDRSEAVDQAQAHRRRSLQAAVRPGPGDPRSPPSDALLHALQLRAHPQDAERRPGDGGGRIGHAAGHGMDHRGMDRRLDRRAGDEAEAIRSKLETLPPGERPSAPPSGMLNTLPSHEERSPIWWEKSEYGWE